MDGIRIGWVSGHFSPSQPSLDTTMDVRLKLNANDVYARCESHVCRWIGLIELPRGARRQKNWYMHHEQMHAYKPS